VKQGGHKPGILSDFSEHVNRITRPLMKVIITLTFCCDNLRKSKFMALESLENSGNFFRLLCGHPVKVSTMTTRTEMNGGCTANGSATEVYMLKLISLSPAY